VGSRVFALNSPTRPNPIALSLVKLLRSLGAKLIVLGLDCFDGTPVLGIKPYRDYYRANECDLAGSYRKLRGKVGETSSQYMPTVEYALRRRTGEFEGKPFSILF
jgi:tRNA (Thr-GGU) A37 N-methylase